MSSLTNTKAVSGLLDSAITRATGATAADATVSTASVPALPYRIGVYLHKDQSLAGSDQDVLLGTKGVGVVRVTCGKTDFAARSEAVGKFARKAAMLAFGAGAETWDAVVAMFPDIEAERKALQDNLHEDLAVAEIVLIK